LSAALPLALPGLRVEARPREASLAIRFRQAIDMLRWQLSGPVVVRQIRRAMAADDPAVMARTAARLRARFARAARLPVSLMNEATDGFAQLRLRQGLTRFTWMPGAHLRDDAAVLYVPGGSFIVERSPQVTVLVCQIARKAGLPVLVCDYRLAPEDPCPAARDDVVTALRLMLDQGLAPQNIAVVAESAGAALALSAAQLLAGEGVRLGALAFLSPWVDLTLPHPGLAPLTRLSAALYLGGRTAADPVASPLYGRLAGLPPMAIHGSQGDPLFGDAVHLSQAAARAGVDVTLRVWPGGMHVFERYFGKDGERSIADLAAFLSARLARLADVA
jgi:acetyl esterase/lipase